MIETRKTFLGAWAAFAAILAWGAVSLPTTAQDQGSTAPPPSFPMPQGPIGGPMPVRRVTPADRLKMNQAQIRKSSERLAEMVGELQKDLEANDTTNVLSLGVIRKAEEIEKLAREIRTLVRG